MTEKLSIGPSRAMCRRISIAPCISASAWMMTDCGTPTPRLPFAPVPASLMQPCLPLAPLEGKTGADVLRKLVEVGEAYAECADGKAALIRAVR
jgi:hypothetical protein